MQGRRLHWIVSCVLNCYPDICACVWADVGRTHKVPAPPPLFFRPDVVRIIHRKLKTLTKKKSSDSHWTRPCLLTVFSDSTRKRSSSSSCEELPLHILVVVDRLSLNIVTRQANYGRWASACCKRNGGGTKRTVIVCLMVKWSDYHTCCELNGCVPDMYKSSLFRRSAMWVLYGSPLHTYSYALLLMGVLLCGLLV